MLRKCTSRHFEEFVFSALSFMCLCVCVCGLFFNILVLFSIFQMRIAKFFLMHRKIVVNTYEIVYMTSNFLLHL